MAQFIKYKDQQSINLDTVTNIRIDEISTNEKFAIRFHTIDGFEKHLEVSSREEALEIEKRVIELTNGIILGE